MGKQSHDQQIRVFLSSPGDVADERALARHLLDEELSYDPLLDGRVTFRVVRWDNPAAPAPLPATLTPQGSVNRFKLKPSECDVVVVVLWSRLGTPLPPEYRKPNGERYLSGTEWEFENAWDAWSAQKRPEIFVYHRTEPPKISVEDPDDPKIQDALDQRRRILRFLARLRNLDGSLRGGFAPYATPTEFKERLANDLKHLLRERLLHGLPGRGNAATAVAAVPPWTGPPYPGLRSFTGEEAAIFFGRGREVDALIARLRDPAQRFLAVVGASGTGKSSLVRAGLLPRLRNGAIEGSQHWPVLAFTPGASGDDPLLALASELKGMLPAGKQKPQIEIARALAAAPRQLSDYADALLVGRPAGTALVLFIDQFEELFTLAADGHRDRFLELLAQATNDPRLRILATLREDFLSRCVDEPDLAPLLQTNIFMLAPPGPTALADMMRRPAERAGLALEEGLADAILRDAGGDPGRALPLVAFCLEQLYERDKATRRLTLGTYRHALGGLQGAIRQQANTVLQKFRDAEGASLDSALPRMFLALVRIDAAGTATRQRASRDELGRVCKG